MPPIPKIEPKILEAAIELFGVYGPYGVTFHDLARKAKVTSASIYRIFRTRERLFEQALKSVLNRSLDPANFLLMIFEEQKGQDFLALVTVAAHKWYDSFTQSGARLIMQASFMNHKWEDPGGPIAKTIKVLATGMEREMKRRKGSNLDTANAARMLLFSLLQLKLSLPASIPSKDEREAVDGLLKFWLRAFSPNS